MRRFILVTLILGTALGAPAAFADHEEECGGDPGDPGTNGVIYISDEGDESNGGRITVGSCDDVPPDGHLVFAGNPNDGCGYLILDGDPTNGDEGSGHVGLEFDEQGVTPVEPGDGDYEPSCEVGEPEE